MAQISRQELKQLNHLVSLDAKEALRLTASYELKYANDPNLQRNLSGFLIDIGSSLEDSNLVQRGIDSTEQMLQGVEQSSHPSLLYDAGNGYMALHDIASRQAGFVFNPDTTPLISAKHCYQKALHHQARLDRGLEAQLRVNYGNCLAALGRSLEAIDEYRAALRRVPHHSMAWGNLGLELEHFAHVAQNPLLLRDAYEALEKALADQALDQQGTTKTRVLFEEARQRINQHLDSAPDCSGCDFSVDLDSHKFASNYHRGYVRFCAKHDLFLNLLVGGRPCKASLQDTVSLSMTIDIGDTTTYPRLARVINEVKERYVAARLLAYEACNPPFGLQPYEEMTQYADNLDYAVYGIQIAKLKLAFESSYNVLDKIAFFINDYLDLGIDESKVNFTTIWREPRQGASLRSEIVSLGNWHLYGLHDMARDLGADGCQNHLKLMRNRLTHRYLVPHTEGIGWLTEADGCEYHLYMRDLAERTIEMLQLVRSAVIYLIAFIDKAERDKLSSTASIVPSLVVQRYKHYPPGTYDLPI